MSINDMLAMSVSQIANLSVVEILSALVQVPSVNPLWQPTTTTPANEKAMAEFLAELFRKLDTQVQVDIEYITPTRPNVMVRITGNSLGWIVWDTHTDTVGVSNMTVPSFGGEIRDGRVWGRGSCDTKASAAIAIKLIFEAMQHGKRPNKNLLLVFSMGEETGGEGAQKVNPWIKRQGILVDQWITSEPTMLKCVFAHNGVVRGQLLVSRRNGARDTLRTDRTLMCFQVTGRSGHTSDPDKASNALYAAAKLALRIREVNGLHVTAFECGGMGNTIPNSCIIVVEQENAVHQSRAELNSLIVQLAADLMDEHLKINCMDPHQASRQMAEADSEVIYAAVRAILTFENEHQRLKTKGLSSVTGLPVISATGLTSNPDATCTISFDRRVVPGEVPNTVFEELLARLEEAMQNPAMVLSVVINPPMRRLSGFATDPNSTLIQELVALSGNQPTTARYGTNLLSVDSQVFVDGKIVAVVFGPGDIAQAHTANEYIEIKQLELAYSLMKRFLGLAA